MSRLQRSLGFAWEGVLHVTATQPNFRIHLVLALAACAAGFGLGIDRAEWAALWLVIGLVLSLECMNTAVEATIDSLGGPPSISAKRAKDAAAAAVLLGALTSIAVGLAIFGPRLWVLLAS